MGVLAIVHHRQYAFERWVRGADGTGQSPVLREHCLQLGACVHPLSGIAAVVTELVASFRPRNRQHLLGAPQIFGSVSP